MDAFSQYGLAILAGASAAGFAVVGWMLLDLRRRITRIFGSTVPDDMQTDVLRRLRNLEVRDEAAAPRIERLEEAARTSVQKVGFIRFNPFQDTGGDNSFTLALLDQENNGFVVSSLYMRECTRLYAKEILRGTPKQQLSEEERSVLEAALNKN